MPADPANDAGPARSLRLFAWFFPLSRIYFFTPVYFLYIIARFAFDEVLLLHAIYYVSVVVCELPSGYLSDRIGRVFTLRVSATAMAASYVLFLTGSDDFGVFACAQALLGLGFASISGTDTAYHYDALCAAGREAEFARRQAALTRNSYWTAAAGVVLAGWLGQFDLAWAYWLCLTNAVLLLGLTAFLVEPGRDDDAGWAVARPAGQLAALFRVLRARDLAWLFGFGIASVILAHLPAEFAQPYLALVLGEDVRDVARTPLAAGLLIGANTAVAGGAAAASLWLRARVGLAASLLGALVWQVWLLVGMAVVVHPVVALLLMTRSCLPAIGQVLVGIEVTPRLPTSLRASYLSLDSLAGRLGYAIVLVGLAGVTRGGVSPDAAGLPRVLWASVAIGALAVALLAPTRPHAEPAAVPEDPRGTPPG